MSMPNRQAWSVAMPHEPDCWCQFCFFRRLERVEAETELALAEGRREPRRRPGPPEHDLEHG